MEDSVYNPSLWEDFLDRIFIPPFGNPPFRRIIFEMMGGMQVSWYDLLSFLSHLCLSPAPSLSPSDSIRPHLPAFHCLCSNSEVYLCNYAMSTLGLALD